MTEGIGWIVEADVSGYFDSLDRTRWREVLRQRVNAGRIWRRMGKWLRAGVIEAGVLTHPDTGVVQGGTSSPGLANISLHVLDMYWAQQSRPLGQLTRYADDMLIVCRTRRAAAQALHAVTQVLQKLTLTVHPTKTRIVAVKSAGCECLGFHFHKGRARRAGTLIPLMWPSQQAMKAIRSHIREQTE
jgi:RNA-directed DNA polymerase